MSKMFETLKTRWSMGYITKADLRRWVAIDQKRPGAGLTAEEYETITGEAYDE